MDVTKLFELPPEKLAPLPDGRLDAMIEQALSLPQRPVSAPHVPANQNNRIRRALAIAAALALVVGVTFHFMPMTQTVTATQSTDDAYEEISDLLILETLNDLG